eukprot:16266-Pyramimonas_sp.AAC.1
MHSSGKRAQGHQQHHRLPVTVMSRSVPYASKSLHTTIRHGGFSVAMPSMRIVGAVLHVHTWADSWGVPQARRHVPSAE